MATLKEVAAAANVSTVTASSVLSGVNRVRVAQATADRIHSIAKSMNYVPLAAARGLRTGKTRIIAFVAATYSHRRWDDAWHEALRGVSDLMWTREERLLLVMPRNREHELEIIRQMAFSRQVDGFIIQASEDDDARLELLNQSGRPFVMMGGGGREEVNGVAFDMDGFASTIIAALDNDCGATLLIMPGNGRDYVDYVYDAFQERFKLWAGENNTACTVWNGAFIPQPEWLNEKRREAGNRKLGVILLRGLLPEMIQALSDADAGGDSQIVYVSNGEDILLPPNGLTIMHFDNYTLGRRSAQLILRMIDGKIDPGKHTNITISATSEI